MDEKFSIRLYTLRQRLTQNIRSWERPTGWEIVAWTLLVTAIAAPYYLVKVGPHPPVGVYITLMGGVAAAVAFRKDPPVREKAAWILVITMLMVAEIRNLYVAEHEQVQTFLAINNGLKETKQGLQQTANGLKETLAESTGGDSFCYVDMARIGPDKLIAHLVRKGRYPVFHVVVTINDVDEFYKDMQSGNITASRRFFKPIEIVPVFSFWRSLTTYPIRSGMSLKTFTAEIDARNGVFHEVLLVRTLQDGSMYRALAVQAFYLSKKQGIVLENVDKDFPKELLAKSQEWQRYENLKKLKTSTDILTGH